MAGRGEMWPLRGRLRSRGWFSAHRLTIRLTFADQNQCARTAISIGNGLSTEAWSTEVTLDDELYVLTGGDGFRIQLDFKQRVYDEVGGLARLEGLPPADPGTDEDSYNVKAASALSAVCLDKRFVFDGGPDQGLMTRRAA
jgi:uncharacterized protein (TIGR04141 family)